MSDERRVRARLDVVGARRQGELLAGGIRPVLAAGGQPAPPGPRYLRRPDARAPGAPKSVPGGTRAGSGAAAP